MHNPGGIKHNILGFYFDAVSYTAVYQSLLQWRSDRESRIVSLVNPYSVLLGYGDPKMAEAIRASSLVLADGVGILLASHILGYAPLSRVSGPTLMLKICDWSRLHGLRHYFYGSQEDVVNKMIDRLCRQFPGLQVAGGYSPPFRFLTDQEDAEIVQRINDAKPDIIWIGLGAPKQEKWMLDHIGKIQSGVMIGVGAAFDFHSENKRWAPEWMRRYGIEWAYRLWQEPRRMWRRNAASGLFLARVFKQFFKERLLRQEPKELLPAALCVRSPQEGSPSDREELSPASSLVQTS